MKTLEVLHKAREPFIASKNSSKDSTATNTRSSKSSWTRMKTTLSLKWEFIPPHTLMQVTTNQ